MINNNIFKQLFILVICMFILSCNDDKPKNTQAGSNDVIIPDPIGTIYKTIQAELSSTERLDITYKNPFTNKALIRVEKDELNKTFKIDEQLSTCIKNNKPVILEANQECRLVIEFHPYNFTTFQSYIYINAISENACKTGTDKGNIKNTPYKITGIALNKGDRPPKDAVYSFENSYSLVFETKHTDGTIDIYSIPESFSKTYIIPAQDLPTGYRVNFDNPDELTIVTNKDSNCSYKKNTSNSSNGIINTTANKDCYYTVIHKPRAAKYLYESGFTIEPLDNNPTGFRQKYLIRVACNLKMESLFNNSKNGTTSINKYKEMEFKQCIDNNCKGQLVFQKNTKFEFLGGDNSSFEMIPSVINGCIIEPLKEEEVKTGIKNNGLIKLTKEKEPCFTYVLFKDNIGEKNTELNLDGNKYVIKGINKSLCELFSSN